MLQQILHLAHINSEKMKRYLSFFASILTLSLTAQVAVGTTSPSSAAALYLESLQPTTSLHGGFLMPVVTESEQALIPVSTTDNSDDGLMVYVSDPVSGKRCWDVYDGEEHVWRSINCNNITCSGDILFQEDFDTYVDGTGVSGASASEGDYPAGVSNWTLTAFTTFGSTTPALPGTLIDNNDYVLTSGGELEFRDTNGPVLFETTAFSISGYTDVEISLDVRATGSFEYDVLDHSDDFNCGNTISDFIDISYSLDGGATYSEITDFAGLGTINHTIVFDGGAVGSDGTATTVSESGITGNTMIIRILAQTWADDERIFIDNLVVSCN